MKVISDTAYDYSVDLAREKGMFPMYNESYVMSKHIQEVLTMETIRRIIKYGIRNSHLLTIAPTGSTSILAGIVSGGLEPAFSPEYKRTSRVPIRPAYVFVPEDIDWDGHNCGFIDHRSDPWEWMKQGDEWVLESKSSTDGKTYRIDRSRGLTCDNIVKDLAVRFLESFGEWNPKADYVVTAMEVTPEQHLRTMAIMAKYVDSSVSKTINLPNDYDYEAYKNIYLQAYRTGTIKGVTTYRDGTMTAVLTEVNNDVCPVCGSKVEMKENCKTCPDCGWGACNV
jgi:ribonucleoside-diphosphate reductase alpha chain